MLVTKAVGLMLAMTIIFAPASFSTTRVWPAAAPSELTVPHRTSLSALAESACQAKQPDLSVGLVIYRKGYATLNGSTPDVGTFIRSGDIITTSDDGFVAIELGNGNVVAVQPSTHLAVECSPDAVKIATTVRSHHINTAHLLGAVRG